MGDAAGERVDVAFGAVGGGDLLGDPFVRDDAAVGDEAEDRSNELRVLGRRDLAVVG